MPQPQNLGPVCAVAAAAAGFTYWLLLWRPRGARSKGCDEGLQGERADGGGLLRGRGAVAVTAERPGASGPGPGDSGGAGEGDGASAARRMPRRDKGSERLRWWQQLNEVKPVLTLPPLREGGAEVLESVCDVVPEVYFALTREAQRRLSRGKDWLVRDSDYGDAPAHSAVKAKVNASLVQTVVDAFGSTVPQQLAEDPRHVLLLLDTPQYGTLREIVAAFPHLRCCQQIIIPQADLRHYFEMVRGGEFYPGVRAQRLDHWLSANAALGLRCLAAFLDFECRLVGALSARLCPAADVMRFFRLGYPAEPASVLALTVGLESPAERPEDVDTFVRWEAALNGYSVELRRTWKYRMVTLLYVVRRMPGGPAAAVEALQGGSAAGTMAAAAVTDV